MQRKIRIILPQDELNKNEKKIFISFRKLSNWLYFIVKVPSFLYFVNIKVIFVSVRVHTTPAATAVPGVIPGQEATTTKKISPTNLALNWWPVSQNYKLQSIETITDNNIDQNFELCLEIVICSFVKWGHDLTGLWYHDA